MYTIVRVISDSESCVFKSRLENDSSNSILDTGPAAVVPDAGTDGVVDAVDPGVPDGPGGPDAADTGVPDGPGVTDAADPDAADTGVPGVPDGPGGPDVTDAVPDNIFCAIDVAVDTADAWIVPTAVGAWAPAVAPAVAPVVAEVVVFGVAKFDGIYL